MALDNSQTTTAIDFVFVADPMNAWLFVTPEDIAEVGLAATSFSPDSIYAPDGRVALDEDADAAIFLAAFSKTHCREAVCAQHLADHDAAPRAWNSYGTASEAQIDACMEYLSVTRFAC